MVTIIDSTKFFGIPGSGKTTRMLTELEKITSAGMPLEQIAFVTFSKSAGEEIKNRILNKFDVDRSDLVWCGTIHSICNRLLDWDLKNNIPKLATEHDRADYLLQYGLTYPIVNTFSTDIPETTISDGDIGEVSDEEKIFAVINWCNNRLVPLNNWKNIEVTFDHIDPSFVFEICKGWLEYKQEKGLVDFDDMLLKTIEVE
ncbi:MAG: UvrD-helicase domain-containing protein [Candidatus Bathyarchaeota archaeon]|nr:UvrD-helicase domain-containing protein [Candidatus Bathyarchaeota archaeon]